MDARTRIAFAALVAAQAVHSAEEYRFRLWEQLAPARAVSATLSIDPPMGFLTANLLLVGFGLLSVWVASRRLAWFWAALESANGIAHLTLAAIAGGYFPGLATAPLLLLAGGWLAASLRQSREAPQVG